MFEHNSLKHFVAVCLGAAMLLAASPTALSQPQEDYPPVNHDMGMTNRDAGGDTGDPTQKSDTVDDRCVGCRHGCVSVNYVMHAFPSETGLMRWTLARSDLNSTRGLGRRWGRPVPYARSGGTEQFHGFQRMIQVVMQGRAHEMFTINTESGSPRPTLSWSLAATVALNEKQIDSNWDNWVYTYRNLQTGDLDRYLFPDLDPTTYGDLTKCTEHVDEHGRVTEVHYYTGGTNADQVAKLRRVEEDGSDGVITEVRVAYYDSGYNDDYVKYAVLRRATRSAVGGGWSTTWGRGDYDDPSPTDPYGDTAWGDSYNIRRVRYYYYDNPDTSNDNDYGRDGCLKMVVVQKPKDGVSAPDADKEGDWTNVKVWYFRYYKQFGPTDYCLKYVLEPAWFARMDADGKFNTNGVFDTTAGDNQGALLDANDLDATSNAVLEDYASHKYEYDGSDVALRISKGCASAGSNEDVEDRFSEISHSPGAPPDYHNNWYRRYTIERYYDDGIDEILKKRITSYVNFGDRVMLKVIEEFDDSGNRIRRTGDYYVYAVPSGKVVFHAENSAFFWSAIDGEATTRGDVNGDGVTDWRDALEYDDTGGGDVFDLMDEDAGNYAWLNNAAGLIHHYEFATSTSGDIDDDVAGDVKGYIKAEKLGIGDTDTPFKLREYEYFANDAPASLDEWETTFVVAVVAEYPVEDEDDDHDDAYVTTYSYTWDATNPYVMTGRTTVRPIVKGDSPTRLALTYQEQFNARGLPTWSREYYEGEETYEITYRLYDIEQHPLRPFLVIRDFDTDCAEVTEPTGWETSDGYGMQLETKYVYDDFGRVVEEIGPRHTVDVSGTLTAVRTVRFAVYKEFDEVRHDEVWTAIGSADCDNSGTWPYDDGDYTYTGLVGPITVTRLCKAYREIERMTINSDDTTSTAYDDNTAPGNGTADDKLNDADVMSIGTYDSPANNVDKYTWSQTHMDMQGQIDWRKTYHNIPATDVLGSAGTNYTSVAYTYDHMGRTKARIFLPDADPATAANLTDTDNRFTFSFYRDSGGDDYKEVRTYNDCYLSGGSYYMAGVANVAWYDQGGELVRRWRGSLSGALAGGATPTGADTLTEESRTTHGYDSRRRPSYTRSYYNINDEYYVESGVDEYDNLGRVVLRYTGVDSEDDPTKKDIAGSVYDGLGRTIETKIGTTSANVETTAEFHYDSDGDGNGDPQPRLKTRSDLGAADNLATFVDTDFTQQVVAVGSGNLRVRHLYDWTEPALGPWTKRVNNGVAEVVVEARAPGSYTGSVQEGTEMRLGRGDRLLVRKAMLSTSPTYVETARYEYGGDGRVSKVTHATGSFSRFEYDDVGRTLRTTLATAETATPTIRSIEEAVNVYDNYGNVVKRALYRRDDDSTYDDFLCSDITDPGPNDSHAQTSFVYTWYDEANRPTDVVNYGVATTTPTDDPTDPTDVPTYSATDHIITKYDYCPTGQVEKVRKVVGSGTPEVEVATHYYYDDLGRTEYIVENEDDFVPPATGIGGNDGEPHIDRVTKFAYNGHSQVTHQTALLTADSQTTRYVYSRELTDKGTPTNLILRNDLLRAIYYPDTDDTFANPMTGADHVVFTYYVNGALRTRTDQNETVHEYFYDDIGRLIEDEADDLGTGVDGFVRSIGYTYNANSGRLEKITSYDREDPTLDSHVRNEIELAYNMLGAVTSSEQSHAAATSTGTFPTVSYTYDTAHTQGHVENGARLTQVTYPTNSRVVAFDYGAADGDGDMLSRVEEIENSAGTTVHAQYTYLGRGGIVGVAHPAVTNGLVLTYDTPDDNYPGLDPFGRVVDMKWQNTALTATMDRFSYTYDVRSNRLSRDVMPIDGSDDAVDDHDSRYSYDALDRLIRAEQGTLEAGSFTKTGRDDFWGEVDTNVWALSPTGNWDHYHLDANGDGNYDGVDDLDQERDHNKVNEIDMDDDDGNAIDDDAITEITSPVTQTPWATPGYNKAGNMDVMPIPTDEADTYTLTYDAWNRLVEVEDGGTTVTQYRYDGRHRQIAKLEFVSADNWTRTDYYHDTAWRVVEERRETGIPTVDKEDPVTDLYAQYVWGLRYIDAPVLRDRNTGGDEAIDETLYFCNDANMNVTAVVDTSGNVVERFEYTPYGQVTELDPDFTSYTGSDYDVQILFAGYRHDPDTGLYHVRHRGYHPTLGRWLTRDPLGQSQPGGGYHDGMNLYEYVASRPTVGVDPLGMFFWLVGCKPKEDVTGYECESVLDVCPTQEGRDAAFAWLTEWGLIGAAVTEAMGGTNNVALGTTVATVWERQYSELWKCCDDNGNPIYLWGEPSYATQTLDVSAHPPDGVLVSYAALSIPIGRGGIEVLNVTGYLALDAAPLESVANRAGNDADAEKGPVKLQWPPGWAPGMTRQVEHISCDPAGKAEWPGTEPSNEVPEPGPHTELQLATVD